MIGNTIEEQELSKLLQFCNENGYVLNELKEIVRTYSGTNINKYIIYKPNMGTLASINGRFCQPVFFSKRSIYELNKVYLRKKKLERVLKLDDITELHIKIK